jgi:V8-like Glu-specific endopeptidase
MMLHDLGRKRARPPVRLTLLATALLALTASLATSATAQPGAEVVYGTDDRIETFALKGARAAAARATVAIVDMSAIRNNGDGTSTLLGQSLGKREQLCPGQRFARQPTPASCSGVLLAPDIVATAGHCVDRATLATTRFVFDFAMTDATRARTTIPNIKIYRPRRILAQVLSGDGSDYAVVQLRRVVRDRKPATLQRIGRIATGTPLYVIGHPNGLPAKLAGGAKVLANRSRTFFKANLDTFEGNSGSPVFDAATNRVAGILVRGDPDYRATAKGCYVLNVRPNKSGNEDVTRATLLVPHVPAR